MFRLPSSVYSYTHNSKLSVEIFYSLNINFPPYYYISSHATFSLNLKLYFISFVYLSDCNYFHYNDCLSCWSINRWDHLVSNMSKIHCVIVLFMDGIKGLENKLFSACRGFPGTPSRTRGSPHTPYWDPLLYKIAENGLKNTIFTASVNLKSISSNWWFKKQRYLSYNTNHHFSTFSVTRCSSLCPPDGVTVPGLPAGLPVFHGCIRRVTVNHRPARLSKPLAVHGAVGTQGCPHM